MTKTPHTHAHNMLLYAQDAAETDRPWERWEMRCWYHETTDFESGTIDLAIDAAREKK